MNKIILFSAAILLTGATAAAFADTSSGAFNQQTGVYMSGNLTAIGGGFYLGDMVTKHFGVEIGVDSIDDALYGTDATIFHADLKGVLPIGTRGQFFAKLGIGEGHTSETILNNTVSTSGFGPTYGVGFGYAFSRHWSTTLEVNGIYSRSLDSSKDALHSIPSVGLTYRF